MKSITYRYKLKSKSKILENRTSPELVLAEISGSFKNKIDSKVIYKKFQYSLEVAVLPKYFGIIREKRGVSNFVYDPAIIKKNDKFNKLLRIKMADFETNIENTAIHFRNHNPTAEEVKNYLQLISGREERIATETFGVLTFLENHIKHLESLIGSGRKDEIKNSTINSFRNLIPILKRYETARNKLIFENLNENLYREFWEVSGKIKTGLIKVDDYKNKDEKPFAANTLKSYQTYFLALCKAAKKKEIKIPLDLTDTTLINAASKVKSEKTEAFLKESDIIKVIGFLPTSRYLRIAKEYILLASQTGMRLQSMQEAKGRQIQASDETKKAFYYIHTVQEKTGTECYTPLFSTALDIIKSNNNRFPDFTDITLANLNINIRSVLKAVKIENSKLFSTHNLRSSFVSNLSILGLSETTISYVTHPSKRSNNSSVRIYDRRDMLDKAQMFTDEVNKVNEIKRSKFYTFGG